MDLDAIRARIVSERERLGLSQDELADRAGVNQSNLSKWEDLARPITEMRVRVLFSLIEKGLGLTLSEFFRQIESAKAGISLAKENPPPIAKAVDGESAHSDLFPNLVPEDQIEARVIRTLARIIARSADEEDHREAANTRAQKAKNAKDSRSRPRRPDRTKKTRRPSQRGHLKRDKGTPE